MTHASTTNGVVTVHGGEGDSLVTAVYDPNANPPWTVQFNWLIAEDEALASVEAHVAAQGW